MAHHFKTSIVFAIATIVTVPVTAQQESNVREASHAAVTINRSNSSVRSKQKEKNEAQNQAILKEIKEIRALMGGGVAKQLEGLYEGIPATSKMDFVPAHSPEAADKGTTMTLDLSGDHVQTELQKMLQSAFEFEIKKLTEEASDEMDSGVDLLIQTPRGNETERLRNAAKYLDMAASELEEVSVFEKADELRRQAQSLRVKARKLKR